MHVFELTLAGFNGSSSKTDHLIVWVAVQASQAEFVQQLSSAGLYPTKVTAVEVLPSHFEAELQISSNLGELSRFIDERLGTVPFDSPIGKAIDALQLACQNPGDPNYRVYKEALSSLVEARRHILLLEKRISDREISPGGDEYSELLGLLGLYMSPSARLARLAADARILGLVPNLQPEGLSLGEGNPLRINVRQVTSDLSSVEDEDVAGVYGVLFTVDAGELTDAKKAAIALDIFHSKQGIAVLDDFEISVLDEEGNLVAPDAEHVDYSCSDAGTVEKISDVPLDATAAGAVIPTGSGANTEAIEHSIAGGKGPFVRDHVDMEIWCQLAPAVADLEEDTVVGRAVVDLLKQFEAIIKAKAKMETYNVEELKAIGVDQCHVWFYG
ncbi:hypothetical protein PQH03_28420 [Ralstonia insidiosa]|jgi:hypothetical protein|uniref:Uncharacterized protein n=1 Tax=Ralstonia insidiosa TaxID=190721 RepID=A0A192A7R8_9RALS|nr:MULTISPECIES: hypothetical protein [Ralstonia]ANJ76525.1 hypothetical protein A9Y76_28480 [Ralstonia insidiosa]MCK8652965.1 hypothetical protein [Ralstonia insidiosa]MDE4928575.1 hypothetical protein [Ralstonia insidiosa]UNK03990.1 hypothetical protein MMB19_29475 [Ralstonia insidiosa]